MIYVLLNVFKIYIQASNNTFKFHMNRLFFDKKDVEKANLSLSCKGN